MNTTAHHVAPPATQAADNHNDTTQIARRAINAWSYYSRSIWDRLAGEDLQGLSVLDVGRVIEEAFHIGISADDVFWMIRDHLRYSKSEDIVETWLSCLTFVESLDEWAHDIANDRGWFDALEGVGIPTHMLDLDALLTDEIAGGAVLVADRVCNVTGDWQGKIVFLHMGLQ